MSVVIDGTSGIDTVQKPALVGKLPAGAVLQVVSASTSSSLSTTSSSDVSTGFSATITPTSSSNKILVRLSGGGMDYGGASSGNYLQGSVYRNGSKLADIVGGTYGNPYGLSISGEYYDSPSSTSAQTYQIYIRTAGGQTGYLLNSPSLVSRPLVLTLTEIAG